jgi:hypothetical protein
MSLNAKHIYPSVIKAFLMASTITLCLTACSDEVSELGNDSDTLQLIPFSQSLVEEGQNSTRAITLPDNYSVYSDLYPQASSQYATIHAYLIANDAVSSEGDFTFNKDAVEKTDNGVITKTGWSSNVTVKQGTNYYVYGFMPASLSSSIAKNSGSYENKAVISLNNLDAVTPADVCIITGVKGFDSPITNSSTTGSVELGSFSYTGKAKGSNYIYLLLDHLYSCVDLEYSLETFYSTLRQIKLRKVEISATGSKKHNLTVTIDGNNNAIYSVSDTETSEASGTAVIYDKTETEAESIPNILEGYLGVPGFYLPGMPNQIVVTSYYDVYNRKGDLVRKGCKADNKLNLRETNISRGQKRTVKFTILPTYLYVLSEPDLDNPTIELTTE